MYLIRFRWSSGIEWNEFDQGVTRGGRTRRSGLAAARVAAARSSLKAGKAGSDEIALRFQGNAFRVIYAVQIDHDLWVIHAFQKKSKTGIKTPQQEVDLIKERLKRLKEVLP